MPEITNCPACDGEGFTANDDERTPWSFWASLTWPSNMAIVLGMVRKIPCEQCNGTGATPCAD